MRDNEKQAADSVGQRHIIPCSKCGEPAVHFYKLLLQRYNVQTLGSEFPDATSFGGSLCLKHSDEIYDGIRDLMFSDK